VNKFDPIDCTGLIANGGVFPQGRFFFDCAIDDEDAICADGGTCEWTVRVSDETTLDVVVQLSPNVKNVEFDRCICFDLYTSCSPKKYERSCSTLTFGGPFQIAGHFDGAVKVPKVGNLACLAARDRQHSICAADADVACVDGHYVSEFKGDPFLGGNWLTQGNLNRDDIIDILDFGTFLGQMNKNPEPGPDKDCADNDGEGNTHGDMNGDGVVDAADYTFIQINFLSHCKNPCCPGEEAGSAVEGITEITVKQLRAMGLEDLIVADLNNDGVLNTDDMAAFAQGARPKATGKNRGTIDRASRASR
jgi:hypothetical protein